MSPSAHAGLFFTQGFTRKSCFLLCHVPYAEQQYCMCASTSAHTLMHRWVRGHLQVEHLVELEPLRGGLVGLPGRNGLSVEQRKRLTIAVELVANPAILFMDEPTSGLDARAAAIVMRVIKNTVLTGRTVVTTIHQPSQDIFEVGILFSGHLSCAIMGQMSLVICTWQGHPLQLLVWLGLCEWRVEQGIASM